MSGTTYSSQLSGRSPERAGFAWQRHLPAEWRDSVVTAIDFTEHREYEMAASRCFGSDEEGHPCFYAHDYALDTIRSDDDEEYYPVVAYGETVRAWRLRDERWLVYRRIDTGEDGSPGRAFYSFSDCPPG